MPLRERDRLRVLREVEQEHWTQVEAAQRSKRTDRRRRFAHKREIRNAASPAPTPPASRRAVHMLRLWMLRAGNSVLPIFLMVLLATLAVVAGVALWRGL